MPTGYTHDLQDGTKSFKDFALQCARAFGATIMQRDEPMTELPKLQEPSDYHLRQAESSKAKLADLLAMTDEQAAQLALNEFNEAVADNKRIRDSRATIEANYVKMLDEVMAWQPPTSEHHELKKFMERQIKESIKFDCSDPYQAEEILLTGADWKAKQVQVLEQSIAYHEEKHAEEVKRTDGRNAWITALYNSLEALPA